MLAAAVISLESGSLPQCICEDNKMLRFCLQDGYYNSNLAPPSQPSCDALGNFPPKGLSSNLSSGQNNEKTLLIEELKKLEHDQDKVGIGSSANLDESGAVCCLFNAAKFSLGAVCRRKLWQQKKISRRLV
jgi:hypothetical protein